MDFQRPTINRFIEWDRSADELSTSRRFLFIEEIETTRIH